MRSIVAARRLALVGALLVGSTACHGSVSLGSGVQGSGVAKTESRDVGTFDTIELDSQVRLELVTGPADKLALAGDENLLPLVTTSVTDGRLVVRTTQELRPKTPLVLTVHAPAVKRVETSGTGDVHATGLKEPSFTLATHGASDAELSGQVDRLEVDLGGAGRVRASQLVAKQVQVELSGAGDVEVNASDTLKADVTGAGSVKYRGSPAVEKNVTGAGSVKPL